MRAVPLLVLFLTACPERAQPERGVALTYKKPEDTDVRSIVDRRLAHLKLKAHLAEDAQRLTIRVTNGAELERIKALMAVRGELRFCEEDAARAEAMCAVDAQNVEVDRNRDGKSCTVSSTKRESLETALGDAGVLVFEKNDARLTAYARSDCFSPHVVGVEARTEPMPGLMLDFDKSSASEFNALTAKLVGRHLLILLDDELQSAPVVLEPITGRSAMLAIGKLSPEKQQALEAALAGGALPRGLELEKEARYGPPTLTGK